MAYQGMSLPGAAGISSVPITNGTANANIFMFDFTFTPGSVTALIQNVKTFSIPGLLTTDCVTVSCTSGLGLGANIANCRASSADTLEITFTTAVVLGVTLGSLNFRAVVFR